MPPFPALSDTQIWQLVAYIRSLSGAEREASAERPNGDAALAYLRKEAPYTQALTPDLLLLDLNMPRKNGREVLTALRSDPALQALPVVSFTSSAKEQDIRDSYALCANLYLQEPLELADHLEKIRALVEFWAKHVAPLPR